MFRVGIDDGVKTELSSVRVRRLNGAAEGGERKGGKREGGGMKGENQLHGFEPNQSCCVFHGRSMDSTAIRAGS
ncbi:MAG: hypothetical protein ACKESB_02470 [Candidatus Hodgkinia cicadicola]